MQISCFFCSAETSVEDTASALDAGWYTHRLTSSTPSMEPCDSIVPGVIVPDSISMGFVCAACVACFPPESRVVHHFENPLQIAWFSGYLLLRCSGQASILGEGFFGGAVRFRNLREAGNTDEDDLSIEPDIHNDSLIYIDYKSARTAITAPIDLDQVSTLVGEAFAFLDGPTMQLLLSEGA
jgi:hypothetical protein